MKNWRNGIEDRGPEKTERSDLPPTFTIIRSGDVGVVIATGPTVHPFRVPPKKDGNGGA